MKKLCLSAMCAAMLAGPAAVLAQSTDQMGAATMSGFDDRWYVVPFAAYTWADEDRGTDDGVGWGLAVGKPVNEWLNLELRVTNTNLVSSGDVADLAQGDFNVSDVAIDGLWVFNRRGTVQPYLLAGIGAIGDSFSCDLIVPNVGKCESDDGWSLMAEAGAGVMFRIAEHASVRIDGRYRYDDNGSGLRRDGSFGDWIATAGVVIPFGGAAPVKTTKTYELGADALFAFNKSTLKPEGVTTMNNLARDLSQVSYDAVRVAGHTDPIGSDAFNQALSERRAATVQNQLISDGVSSDRISSVGYGETQLKVTEAECAGAKGREALIACLQPNRRVEVTVEGMTEKK
jgi:OOP family OmpA-OmpF porin